MQSWNGCPRIRLRDCQRSLRVGHQWYPPSFPYVCLCILPLAVHPVVLHDRANCDLTCTVYIPCQPLNLGPRRTYYTYREGNATCIHDPVSDSRSKFDLLGICSQCECKFLSMVNCTPCTIALRYVITPADELLRNIILSQMVRSSS
jgi:hypothetical protein